MKSFVKKIILFIFIPFILLLGLYLYSDPFKSLHKFSLEEFSTVNREYLSVGLFLRNNPKQHYNSFIFGSSKGCAINTYQWKSYLSDMAKPFLFQAWGETITGISQKVNYLDNNNIKIKHAIVLIDIPGSFRKVQEPKTALGIKHYLLSGKPKIYNEAVFFYAFMKPSKIGTTIKELVNKPSYTINFDTVSNDWNKNHRYNYKEKPQQDSTANKDKFYVRPTREVFSEKIIDEEMKTLLTGIHSVFLKQKTDYTIIITPDYSQLHINKDDLVLLYRIFGEKNVFNWFKITLQKNYLCKLFCINEKQVYKKYAYFRT